MLSSIYSAHVKEQIFPYLSYVSCTAFNLRTEVLVRIGLINQSTGRWLAALVGDHVRLALE